MRRHLGPETDDYVERINAISPVFTRVRVEFPFGDLYTRDILDDRVRYPSHLIKNQITY